MHPESDQHQNWTSSRGSPPASTHQIWWWSMNPFLRYLADKNSAHAHTHTQTDTRRWPQDLAAYGTQVIKYVMLYMYYLHFCKINVWRDTDIVIADSSNSAHLMASLQHDLDKSVPERQTVLGTCSHKPRSAYAFSVLQCIWLANNTDWSNPLEAQHYQVSRQY